MLKIGQKVVVMPRDGIVNAGTQPLLSGDTATVKAITANRVTVQAGPRAASRVTLLDTEVRAA
jgi:hypothetical protein